MAKPNDTFENPRNGDKVQFLITSKESNGEVLKVQIWNRPGVEMPPEHFHPLQTERMDVIQGEMGVKLNAREHVLSAGQKVTVPRNTPHRTWNAGGTELILTSELRPALKSEYFIETVIALASEGKTNAAGVPKNFLQFATILNEHYGELFVTNPPVPVQKFTAKLIGGVGKLLGYKGYIPYRRN
jgi:quercetin dioxygenase-like cupin family protein